MGDPAQHSMSMPFKVGLYIISVGILNCKGNIMLLNDLSPSQVLKFSTFDTDLRIHHNSLRSAVRQFLQLRTE